MNIKSSICGIQHTCINFLIFLIITKIDCWPVFKQDPLVYRSSEEMASIDSAESRRKKRYFSGAKKSGIFFPERGK